MNRILAGAAVAVALLGSATAFAASTAPTTTTSTPTPAATAPAPVDYAARCTALADQWKTAEAANATNKHLGKAKAKAAKGAKLCASKKDADHKKGSAAYEAALKLIGVTPNS